LLSLIATTTRMKNHILLNGKTAMYQYGMVDALIKVLILVGEVK
jgi:hypothetical protein